MDHKCSPEGIWRNENVNYKYIIFKNIYHFLLLFKEDMEIIIDIRRISVMLVYAVNFCTYIKGMCLSAILLTQPSVNEIISQGESAMSDGGAFSAVSEQVDQLGGGSYNVMLKVGIWVIVLLLMFGALKLAFSDSSTRNDSKSGIITKVIAAVLLFAAIGIVVVAQNVGVGLFSLAN